MRFVLFSTLGLLLAACNSKPAAAAEGPEGAALAYQLEVAGPVKVKKGEQGAAKLVIVPKGEAHVDPRAPMELSATSGPAVELAKKTLGHPDGKETAAKGVEFQLPFTAKATGPESIKVHADFYLCTAKICERQKADVTLAVVVE